LLITVIAVHGTVTEFKSPQFQEHISLLHISIYLYFIDAYTYVLIIIYRDKLFLIFTTLVTAPGPISFAQALAASPQVSSHDNLPQPSIRCEAVSIKIS
jgi:hypothetical protein